MKGRATVERGEFVYPAGPRVDAARGGADARTARAGPSADAATAMTEGSPTTAAT
jgi:hypothetical protein